MMVVKKYILDQLKNHETSNNCNTFLNELRTIYQSEKRLNETLPVMILNAQTPKIVSGLTKHLKFTQEHLLRLETLFTSINEPIES